jgi:GT2 family glycosyltransferase
VETARPIAPPVVAVMVVHDPGPYFAEVLRSLAAQDYGNLKTLVLITGDPGDLPAQIAAAVPRAFVRAVDGNPGFGPTANEVLRLVEGDNGFFCFLHDDVALDPDAIRLLVEELYRSNAGVVGPKLVEWDDPTVLQHVGSAVDRFGEIDPVVEPGETDQEQHDAVRDVFALPSACLLVRADLFRTLGGFAEHIDYHGEDLDFCWRAHHQGARVLVVPSARGRHVEGLDRRRPDLPHELLRARHRMAAVATLTGARRLPLLSIELVLATVSQALVGVVTGHAARAWAELRALLGLVPRVPSVVVRRRALAAGRLVPDREVTGLQMRGSARIAVYLRSRDARPDPMQGGATAWRQRAGVGAAIGWTCVVVALGIGTRHLLTDGVPSFGQFLPFDPSPRHLLHAATSGWNQHGLGSTSPSPTGLSLVAIGSVVTLFHMGLFHTLSVVGLVLAGAIGTWRLSGAFSTNRARLVAVVVYLAVPLHAQLVSQGRWAALLCTAAMPWSVDAMRRSAGLHAGPDDEVGERTVSFGARRHVQLLAGGSLVAAIAVAFAPAYLLLLVIAAVLVAVATLVTGAPLAAAARLALAGLVAAAVAAVLNGPWLLDHLGTGGWTAIVGPPPAADVTHSAFEVVTFDLGPARGVVLVVGLYLPVLTAVLLGRGWRLGWAVRAAVLVLGFGWLAVAGARGVGPVRLPETGMLLAPVALGLALAAACVAASLEVDVLGGSFGWRQPLALLAAATVVVGVVPGVIALGNGRLHAPSSTLVDLMGQFPEHPADGDYHILWVGDQRVLPVAPQPYRNGIGWAVSTDRQLTVADAFATPTHDGDADVTAALDAMASGSTTRAGRLLAPFAIRFVVVPLVDGGVSRSDDPLLPPTGLLDALGDQLDLAQVYSPPNFVVYENRAWVPLRSVLTGAAAEASQTAGAASLAQADLAGGVPLMVGADPLDVVTADIAAGTVHLAVPFDRNWTLRAGGADVEPRPAFGATLAFDVAQAGPVTIEYRSPSSVQATVIAQLVGWLLVLAAASGVRIRRVRSRRRTHTDSFEPVLAFDPLMGPLEQQSPLDPDDDDDHDDDDHDGESDLEAAPVSLADVFAAAPADDPTVMLRRPFDPAREITGEHPVIDAGPAVEPAADEQPEEQS